MDKKPDRPVRYFSSSPVNGEIDMQVVFNPANGHTDYRPVVVYGTSWMAEVTFLAGDGPFVCNAINMLIDGSMWFTLGWVEKRVYELHGITCTVSQFSKTGLVLLIENKNTSGKQIVLQVTPQFSNGEQTLPGVDPQIVLPPEKDNGPPQAAR